jgi:PAS domain S-box-containing protein
MTDSSGDVTGGRAEDIDPEPLRESFNRIVRVAVELLGGVAGEVAIRRASGVWRSSGRTIQHTPVAPRVEASAEGVWLEDWREDPSIDPALVADDVRNLRLYVGAPIRLADGRVLGVLSVMGATPKPKDEVKAARLMDLAGLIADEVERHRALVAKADALRRAEASEQRLKLAMEIGDLAMWEMDLRRATLTSAGVNPIPSETHSLDFFDLTEGGGVWQAVHPHDRPALLATWKRHCEAGEPFRGTVRLLRSDGPHVWVEVSSEAVRDESGEIVRIVNVLRNVDAIKRGEIALQRARDAAEAANRAKSEFLANMSHEIRTPLNGVMGVASALSRTELSETQREMVGLITGSAETLAKLLSDVLDLARIESGRLELKPEAFDLDQAVRDAASLFRPAAGAKGLTLDVQVAPAARGRFVGDAARIRQVVSNLVSNAVKFTAAGSVRIAVRAKAAADATALRITVADTGIGFDAQAAERLFERFEQADGSISRRFGGAGLGLAISRSLAQTMGGRLTAASRRGRGATFTFELTLPRAAAAPAQATAGDRDAPDLSRLKVLLAEDHPTNRRVIELILGAAGVGLVCVENGAEALAAWRRGGFDLILMDMQMPVMDGLTATRAIREAERRESLPRTPILALTANAMHEHAHQSAAAGADGHLTKPISAEALLAAVAGAAPETRAAAERLSA